VKLIYSFKHDRFARKVIRESANKYGNTNLNTPFGLVGSKSWFNALNESRIETHTIEGTISNYRVTGHNDYSQFDLLSEQGTTTWAPHGKEKYYREGNVIRIEYTPLRESEQMIHVWLLSNT